MDNPEKLATLGIRYTRHKTKTNQTKTQHNMCLDTIIDKQTQIK